MDSDELMIVLVRISNQRSKPMLSVIEAMIATMIAGMAATRANMATMRTCSLDAALPECDERAFGAGTLAYDMMYGAQSTVFMRHAQTLGARAADGLGMLVEQAAESFFVWRGVRPEGAPVLAALRAQLAAQPA